MTTPDHPSGSQQITELPVDFQGFHQLHRPAYIHWAETYLGCRSDAEKAVDQAFERLARTWSEVLQKENPNAWAWKVMRHHTTELAQRRGRRPLTVGTEVFDTLALHDTADPVGQFEDSVRLHHAVRQLTDRQQDVVVLLFFRGYTAEQVADHLGVTAAGVRSTVRYAKARLRELLGHGGNGDEADHPGAAAGGGTGDDRS